MRWVWGFVGLAALVAAFAPLPAVLDHPQNRTFRLQASRFQYAPAELRVNPGDTVTIELEAQDVVHGLEIDGYNLNTTADPGQPASLTFVADKPGAFRFRCSVTCGNLHPFMIGKLYVGQNTLLFRALGLALIVMAAGVWRLWK